MTTNGLTVGDVRDLLAAEQVTGRVVTVQEQRWGSTLTADAAIGVTVLSVAQVGDFDEDGGQVLVGGDLYDYSDVNEDASTITIDPPLSVASAVDDPVDVFDPEVGTITVEYVALVLLDDSDPDDEPIEVGIQRSLYDYLGEGVRGGPAEVVTLVRDGEDDWMVLQVDGAEVTNVVVDQAIAASVDAITQAEGALTAAQLAQAILDGEIDYYYTTSAPWANGSTAHDDAFGDVWVDTDSIPQQAYRWLNRTWTPLSDGGLVAALFAAQNAQVTADGKIKHFIQSTTPVAEGYGDEWTHTGQDNRKYYWDGDSWEPIIFGDDALAGELSGKIVTGGLFRTAASGTRLEMSSTNTGQIRFFYTTDSSPRVVMSVSSDANTVQFDAPSGLVTVMSDRFFAWERVRTPLLVGSGGVINVDDALHLNTKPIDGVTTLEASGRVTAATVTISAVETGDGSAGSALRIFDNGHVFKPTSSRRYKTDIEDLDVDVDAGLDLRPRRYLRLDTGDEAHGYITEEAHALGLTRWVGYDEEGRPESFNYESFAAVVHQAALRQHRDRIAQLEHDRAEDRTLIADLTARLEVLEAQ